MMLLESSYKCEWRRKPPERNSTPRSARVDTPSQEQQASDNLQEIPPEREPNSPLTPYPAVTMDGLRDKLTDVFGSFDDFYDQLQTNRGPTRRHTRHEQRSDTPNSGRPSSYRSSPSTHSARECVQKMLITSPQLQPPNCPSLQKDYLDHEYPSSSRATPEDERRRNKRKKPCQTDSDSEAERERKKKQKEAYESVKPSTSRTGDEQMKELFGDDIVAKAGSDKGISPDSGVHSTENDVGEDLDHGPSASEILNFFHTLDLKRPLSPIEPIPSWIEKKNEKMRDKEKDKQTKDAQKAEALAKEKKEKEEEERRKKKEKERAARKEEKERERREQEKKDAEKKEQEKKDAERKEQEKKDAERKEQERKDAEKKEQEKKEAEKREREKKEAEEKAERERQRKEAERKAAEKEKEERKEAEKREKERKAAEEAQKRAEESQRLKEEEEKRMAEEKEKEWRSERRSQSPTRLRGELSLLPLSTDKLNKLMELGRKNGKLVDSGRSSPASSIGSASEKKKKHREKDEKEKDRKSKEKHKEKSEKSKEKNRPVVKTEVIENEPVAKENEHKVAGFEKDRLKTEPMSDSHSPRPGSSMSNREAHFRCAANECVVNASKTVKPDPYTEGTDPAEFYQNLARVHKRQADSSDDHLRRILLYLDSVAYFVLSAKYIVDRDANSTKQKHASVIRDTLNMLTMVTTRFANSESLTPLAQHFVSRVRILSLRIQSIMSYQNYTFRSHVAVKSFYMLQQQEDKITVIEPDEASASTGANAKAKSPGGTSTNSVSNKSGTGDAGKIVQMPHETYLCQKQQLKTLHNLMFAHRLWDDATTEASKSTLGTSFIKSLESACGTLNITSDIEKMAIFLLNGVHWMREEYELELVRPPPPPIKIKKKRSS